VLPGVGAKRNVLLHLGGAARTACACAAAGAIALASLLRANDGGVAERLKAHAWKVCMRETVSRVRIPPPPPRVRSLTSNTVATLDGSNCRLFPETCAGSAFDLHHRDNLPPVRSRCRPLSLEADFRQYGRH
jgi:hypothetical protein